MSLLLRALPPVPGVVHGFSTREGGVSTGSLASLNLALRACETPEHLVENWRRVVAELDGSLSTDDLALVDQVHGAGVLRVDAGRGPLRTLGAADALVTTSPGVVLAIRTADCVPILVANEHGVAAIHAGWRGIAAGVVHRALDLLADATGTSHAVAAVGPHIGRAAYEVGSEVFAGIAAAGVPLDVVRHQRHADLRAAVVHQLAAHGIQTVGHVERCTATDPAFFSHRAQGPTTGRLAAVIARCR